MESRPASEWRRDSFIADWPDELIARLNQYAGFDKAAELRRDLEAVSDDLLEVLGERPLSERTMRALSWAVSAVVRDGHPLIDDGRVPFGDPKEAVDAVGEAFAGAMVAASAAVYDQVIEFGGAEQIAIVLQQVLHDAAYDYLEKHHYGMGPR